MRKVILAFMIILLNFSVTSAAQIDSAKYQDDENLIYPVIATDNAEVFGKINAVIRTEIKNFLVRVNVMATDGFEVSEVQAVSTNFEVPCNYDDGILSIVITEYVNFKNAAHPMTFRKALNFNSNSGVRITADSLSEIADEEFGESSYSPKNLTRKLKLYAKKNNIYLYSDFEQLTTIPEDFYFDNDLHVHFIFQQYEVAPYAAGIIEFDATPDSKS